MDRVQDRGTSPILLGLGCLIAAMLIAVGLTLYRTPVPVPTPAEKNLSAIDELRAELAAPPSLDPEAVRAMERRLGLLEQLTREPAKTDYPHVKGRVANELARLREDLEALRQGDGYFRKDRSNLLAYRSELDDSYQPFEVFLPKTYDRNEPHALVVYLHGYGHFHPLQCRAREIGEAIVMAPQGRGAMDYMLVGEEDVLRAIEETCRLFAVDKDRVYLAGSSMGGTGCWQLATRYPDRFAGIVAGCGNTDVQVWRERWRWRIPADSPQADVREFLRDDTSSVSRVANLWNVPVISLHGEEDQINNRAHADRMIAALKAVKHPNWRFHLLPLVGHGFAIDHEKALADCKRNPRPERIRYTTSWLRYPGTDWLRIVGLQRRLRRASVDGKADPRKGTVEVTTQNVARLEIVTRHLPLMDGPVRLQLDGQTVPFEKSSEDKVAPSYARNEEGVWAPASPIVPDVFPPSKNSTIEGPVEHVFLSRFLLVTPDGEGPTAESARCAADDFSQLWQHRYVVPCRMARADEVESDEIQRSNLVLFGLPEDNSLLARILPKLPVKYEPDGFEIGGKKYGGPNAGLKLCYPNPLAPHRYVALMSGLTPDSYVDMHRRLGNWFDWIVYDFRSHFDFAVFDDLTTGRHPESMPVWGFFGENWELRSDLLFTGVPEYREGRLPRKLPTVDLTELPDAGAELPQTLYLDELKPLKIKFPKEYLERNRTLEGKPLMLLGRRFERGLCCRFPCTLTFPCDGYTRLTATAGIEWDGVSELSPDRVESEEVTVRVVADNALIYQATEQTYRDEPLKIDVELNGARQVRLSVSGGRVWLNGSFVWADARLER